ncbi:unnamed protein product [Callosobruchus maculatus]|uniref:Uncharacterized protein n=1 Tax=Callosobruchus maculatus TaxID=64391 RepID=A0A653D6V1_CALMS|nr:unnamed protein product [Callosobruchus maculatus]
MSTTLIPSLVLLCLIGFSNASNCTQCPLLPAVTSSLGMSLIVGSKIWYVQQRYGPPIIAEKCWSSTFYLSDFNVLENAFNVNWTFYDPNEKSPSSRVKMNVIANSAKFYVVFNNKEVSITNLIVTPELIVGSLCSDSKCKY